MTAHALGTVDGAGDTRTARLTAVWRSSRAEAARSAFGEPDDLVTTLLWLCSPASRFVTGVVVPVDGGFSAFGGRVKPFREGQVGDAAAFEQRERCGCGAIDGGVVQRPGAVSQLASGCRREPFAELSRPCAGNPALYATTPHSPASTNATGARR